MLGKSVSNRMKNVAKISSGNIIGQLISIATLPFIARIYGAEIMGIWTVISSISNILMTFCDLGLSQALMISEEEEKVPLYRFISTFSVLSCFCSSVIVFIYYAIIGDKGFNYSILVSLFTFVYSFTLRQVQTCYTLLNREKEYTVLMKNPIINHGTMALLAIVIGMIGGEKYGYYIGMTLGQLLTLLHMKRKLPSGMFFFDVQQGKKILAKYNDFVKFQMPTLVMAQLRQQLPNLLIGSLFGNIVLGYYSISFRLLNMPVTFIGQALGRVFYQAAAEMQRKGENISLFVYRNLKRAILLACIPMAFFAAYGDIAVILFFGIEYSVGGIISRIVVFQTFFTFVSTSTQGLDIVLRKQKVAMITCIAQTITSSLSVISTYYITNNIYVCVVLMTITFVVIQILYFCKMFVIMGNSPKNYLKNIIPALCIIGVSSLVLRMIYDYVVTTFNLTFLMFY